MQGLKIQVNGTSIDEKGKILKNISRQCQALEKVRSSLDAKKKAKLEEMKPKLIEAVSELQASKKLKVEISTALKKA